jgi:hypothetical protein
MRINNKEATSNSVLFLYIYISWCFSFDIFADFNDSHFLMNVNYVL